MTAHRVRCAKSFVALVNGGPLCINDRSILLTISLSIGPRLICSTLLRRPLEASKTVEGVLWLLLSLLLRLGLLCPCCSLQACIQTPVSVLHHTNASVSGASSCLAAFGVSMQRIAQSKCVPWLLPTVANKHLSKHTGTTYVALGRHKWHYYAHGDWHVLCAIQQVHTLTCLPYFLPRGTSIKGTIQNRINMKLRSLKKSPLRKNQTSTAI